MCEVCICVRVFGVCDQLIVFYSCDASYAIAYERNFDFDGNDDRHLNRTTHGITQNVWSALQNEKVFNERRTANIKLRLKLFWTSKNAKLASTFLIE